MSVKKWAYYNDFDAQICDWVRGLIKAGLVPDGEVDQRSITEVQPEEVQGFAQCHWFCGILGWPLALQLAGWPVGERVWTGSCPCQPFSVAGRGKAQADTRHLWPAWFRLIRECRPERVFGEQVAGAIGWGWLDGVSTDVEKEGYTFGAVVLGAHSVGAPHIRQRVYWVADVQRGPAERRGYDLRGTAADRQGEARKQRFRLDAGHGGNPLGLPDASRAERRPQTQGRLHDLDGADAGREEAPGGPGLYSETGGLADNPPVGWRQGDSDGRGLVSGSAAPSERDGLTDDRLPVGVPHPDREGWQGLARGRGSARERAIGPSGADEPAGLSNPAGNGAGRRAEAIQSGDWEDDGIPRAAGPADALWLRDSEGERRGEARDDFERSEEWATSTSAWDNYDLIGFKDGKVRRTQSGLEPLVAGVPFRLADGRTNEQVSRTAALRGIGNAIVPEVAAEFVAAYMAVAQRR